VSELGRPSVGLFDSGVGGLSVWREIERILPQADLVYVADQGHCPYGSRSADEVRSLSSAATAFLLNQGVHVVVVACNTASAAALHDLRARYVAPIVGMEPAVKPAAAQTQSGHVGVIATQVTFQGALFASLLERFAQDVEVHTQVCPGLVECVERGALDTPETEALLRRYLQPLLDAEIDVLVLGCTHYPFLQPAIARVVGPGVAIIDPAPAVARQTVRVLAGRGLSLVPGLPGKRLLYTTGPYDPFADAVARLLGETGELRAATWREGKLVPAAATWRPGDVKTEPEG
jgi:glutamate racemase